MAITALSTPAEIEAEYLVTAGYDCPGDVELCQRFIVACRAILLRRPTEAARGAADASQSMKWNLDAIKQELDAARQWLAYAPAATQARGGGITHPDFSQSRDYSGQDRSYGTGY